MPIIQSAATRYFSRQSLPYWSILLLDSCFILASMLLVYGLNHGFFFTLSNFTAVARTCLFYLIPYIVGFRIFRTYSGIIRFSSFVDLRRIAFAVLFGCAVDVICQRLLGFNSLEWLMPMRFSDMGFSAIIALALMWAVRIWVKTLYDTTNHSTRNQPVFIYGVRNGGVAIAKNINSSASSPYVISGFISDGTDMIGKRLMDVKVYPNDEHLVEEMKKSHAATLLVSPLKSDAFRRNETMVNHLIEGGIRIMMFPSAQEWDGKSEINYTQLKEVNVEDLLPRDKIEIDMTAVADQLQGKRIMITGAAGSIGSEMVRQVASFGPGELLLIDQAETPLHDIRLMMAREWPDIPAATIVSDIANESRMEELFSQFKPEYVFHAAAYKHVPMMEDNPYESIRNNVYGTRVIADLAVKYGTRKFVMVSTDKAVNPTNVMGCSKRICEIYVQALDKAIKDGKIKGETAFITTRFGNVLGSNGSVIPLFERQIKAGGPVTVTHPDIIRFFMLIPEACKLVLEAGTMGKGGEIFVFDMGKPVRIADLARRMIKMSGAKNIEIKYSGLRDGEKLYEEVLNDKEITLPTFNRKIKIAKVREYDYGEVSECIASMVELALTADDMTIVASMKALVPEFKSQHSKFESLDK